MTAPIKWALAAGVLVLAVIAALLPRDEPVPAPAPAAAKDFGPARVKAALVACPSGTGDVPQLRGVTAQCLGDGSSVELGTALAGRTTLVNLWATWCWPCRAELPVLDAYGREPGAVGVLTVQVASGVPDGLELLAGLGVRLPAVHDGDDPSGPVRTALKAPQTLPASYLVTSDGRVRFIENPRVFGTVDQVRAAVGNAA